MSDITPIKFLGATVLSFNADVGLGSAAESSLKVDLVEDCVENDLFELKADSPNYKMVGAPAYFSAGAFSFGGVINNFTANQGAGGETYTVNIVDPRQLLGNVVVVTDTYLGNPRNGVNYINVYNYYENLVLQGNCSVFGSSMSGERGMPYQMALNGLIAMDATNPIIIYSPTEYPYRVSFASFPQGFPEYYRISGPSISLLQMLQDMCDAAGYDFYVNLIEEGGYNYIIIGLIDLKIPVTSFESLLAPYDGYATEISYGQELRNDITKSVLFGEKVHYFGSADKFLPYFGEDLYGTEYFPVVPFGRDECGFYINKKIDTLNGMLDNPFSSNGPYTISELDIRAAMSSFDLWLIRVCDPDLAGTLNAEILAKFPEIKNPLRQALNDLNNAIKDDKAPASDKVFNPKKALVKSCTNNILAQLDIIHRWVKQLGDTYYGKQFISLLNQKICYYQLNDAPFAEKVFSDIPTNEGAWVDDGVPVLGLYDPELSTFRENDNRIGCFALFNDSGINDTSDPPTGSDGDLQK